MARDAGARSGLRGACLVGLGVAAAAVVSVATVAFACTPQCCFFDLSVTSGPPGTRVVVSGQQYGGMASELRWGGINGPVLATSPAQDGPWDVDIVIPDAVADFYVISSVPITTDNSLQPARRSQTFRVTSPAANPAPTEQNPVPPLSPGDQGTPSAGAPASPAAEPAATVGAATDQPAASSSPASSSPAVASPVVPAARDTVPKGTPAGSQPQPSAVAGIAQVATTPPTGVVPSPVPPGSSAPVARAETTPAGVEALPRPWSNLSALEGWSGLDSGGRSEGPLGIGLALLGIGSVGLFGGIVVLAARRSRVKAR